MAAPAAGTEPPSRQSRRYGSVAALVVVACVILAAIGWSMGFFGGQKAPGREGDAGAVVANGGGPPSPAVPEVVPPDVAPVPVAVDVRAQVLREDSIADRAVAHDEVAGKSAELAEHLPAGGVVGKVDSAQPPGDVLSPGAEVLGARRRDGGPPESGQTEPRPVVGKAVVKKPPKKHGGSAASHGSQHSEKKPKSKSAPGLRTRLGSISAVGGIPPRIPMIRLT